MSSAMRDRRRQRWVERAERVRDAFGLVLVLVLTTYVLTSLLGDRGWPAVIVSLSTCATSIVALTGSHVGRRLVRLAVRFAVFAVALAVVAALSDQQTWLNISSGIQIVLLTAATAAVLKRIVTTPEVGSRTILGAISVYAVLGLLFTFVYATVNRIQTPPFFEAHQHVHAGDFLFFSYTTLTTTGYGNLVPGGQPGRMIAGLEMMIGQIFLVTLVAGLVALWRPGDALRQRQERRAEPSAGDPSA
jgi:hypothetical protein